MLTRERFRKVSKSPPFLNARPLHGALSTSIAGHSDTPVSVVLRDGKTGLSHVQWTGSTNPGGAPLPITLVDTLEVGDALSVGGSTPERVALKAGVNTTWDSGNSRLYDIPYPQGATVGNMEFEVLAAVQLRKDIGAYDDATDSIVEKELPVMTMAVAFTTDPNNLPVLPHQTADGNASFILDTPVTLPATGGGIGSSGVLVSDLPIPNDQNLAGSIVLVQFWLLDASGFYSSSITGFLIDKPLPSSPTPSQAQQVTACQCWCENLVQQGSGVHSGN